MRNCRYCKTLHFAATNGHVDCIYRLAAETKDIDLLDENGASPLMCAAQFKNIKCVEALISLGADVNKEAKGFYESDTPLVHAVIGGNIECVQALIKAFANVHVYTVKRELTLLHMAVIKGYSDIVELLLKCGVDPFALSNDKETALDIAIFNRFSNRKLSQESLLLLKSYMVDLPITKCAISD